VEVHYDEGVANRIGPEPCVGARDGIGEASAGKCIGQPLNRESANIPGADPVPLAEGNTDGRVMDAALRRHGHGRACRDWRVAVAPERERL
jgi:hypothetical protein